MASFIFSATWCLCFFSKNVRIRSAYVGINTNGQNGDNTTVDKPVFVPMIPTWPGHMMPTIVSASTSNTGAVVGVYLCSILHFSHKVMFLLHSSIQGCVQNFDVQFFFLYYQPKICASLHVSPGPQTEVMLRGHPRSVRFTCNLNLIPNLTVMQKKQIPPWRRLHPTAWQWWPSCHRYDHPAHSQAILWIVLLNCQLGMRNQKTTLTGSMILPVRAVGGSSFCSCWIVLVYFFPAFC